MLQAGVVPPGRGKGATKEPKCRAAASLMCLLLGALRGASVVLLPYTLWVTIALALNYYV
jgi:hypothetical protein